MLWAIAYGTSSYLVDQNFWPRQVQEKWARPGIAVGIHGGFYGDLFVLPALFWYLTAKYGSEWSSEMVGFAIKIGFTVTFANHLLLIFTQTVPDPFGWKGERWSLTIFFHFLYMWIAVMFIALMYFTPGTDPHDVALGSIVVGVHMMAGTHVFLGIVNRWKRWSWCPDLIASPTLPLMLVGLWAVLTGFAMYAGGVWAAILVGMTALCLLGMAQATLMFGPGPIRR
ncbi:MAG: hypothetical protein JWN18_177 [Parcubacteria group bacterium]|nr:hypothetical protein [Parcubacteria group bacterium]